MCQKDPQTKSKLPIQKSKADSATGEVVDIQQSHKTKVKVEKSAIEMLEALKNRGYTV